MTWSGDAGMPWRRRAWAASTKKRDDALGAGMAEHVVVPAGAGARRRRSPVDRPSRRCVHGTQVTATLTFGRPRSAAASAADRGDRRIEGRDVPGAADDGDDVVPSARAARMRAAHVGLAPRVERRRDRARPARRPSPRRRRRTPAHRRRGARRRPPTTVRGRARRRPRPGRRAGRAAARPRRPASAPDRRSGRRRGPGAGRWPRTGTPCSTAHDDRLPLRAELGERGEHGPLLAVDDVAEQGDRRDEPGVADPAQRGAGVGRRLDEHDVGSEDVEGAPHRARRARPVVADPEQVQPSGVAGRTGDGLRRARGRRRRSRPNRHGRAPPPRGTPARPPRRAAGRARRRRRCRRRRRSARSVPSPKWAARARPLVTTEIASAVDSVPVGVFRLVRPSAVTPSRSSRKIVTTRRISSDVGRDLGQGQRRAELGDALGDDRHLLLGRGRQRQHDRVEAPAQGAGQLVDPPVAVVGRGDEVEALHGGDLGVELGHRAAPSRTGS